MGRFVITRTEAGVSFVLYSERGRVLAVSKAYATLDTCKKAICSLVQYLPACPVTFRGEGQHANPKCEITDGYAFEIKAPNGKSVLTQGPFATRKACLRAVSMLRAGVQDAEVLLSQAGQARPLKVGKLTKG